jgi:hypothetical protein
LQPATGDFQVALRNALRDLQGAAGLQATDWPDRPTWQELRKKLCRTASRPLRVLLLQQDAKRSIRSQRGIQASSADPVAIYSNFGVHVSVVRNPRSSIARDWAEYVRDPKDRLDILHICAGLETSKRTPVLNFGEPGSSEALSAARISELVQSIATGLPPLVVLDVLTPASAREQIRQLLLRNVFCDELTRLGKVHAVLGTGLAPEYARAAQLDVLVRSLADRENPAGVWQRLVGLGPPGPNPPALETAIAELGTALFSYLPPDALMEPGIW